MRIHSDTLTSDDVREAAEHARVSFTRYGEGKSRSHAYAFDVILTGESRRRQNGGTDYAATWDQWGVFLGFLYALDPSMVCGTVKRPIYANLSDFDFRTDSRFDGEDWDFWPSDAHGDHTFRYAGVPFQQNCTKCSAVQRWQ